MKKSFARGTASPRNSEGARSALSAPPLADLSRRRLFSFSALAVTTSVVAGTVAAGQSGEHSRQELASEADDLTPHRREYYRRARF